MITNDNSEDGEPVREETRESYVQRVRLVCQEFWHDCLPQMENEDLEELLLEKMDKYNFGPSQPPLRLSREQFEKVSDELEFSDKETELKESINNLELLIEAEPLPPKQEFIKRIVRMLRAVDNSDIWNTGAPQQPPRLTREQFEKFKKHLTGLGWSKDERGFLKDVVEALKAAGIQIKGEGGIPFVAFSNAELEVQVTKGDLVPCHICGGKHPLEYGKTKDGKESAILGFFKCGKNSYLASIGGGLVPPPKQKGTP